MIWTLGLVILLLIMRLGCFLAFLRILRMASFRTFLRLCRFGFLLFQRLCFNFLNLFAFKINRLGFGHLGVVFSCVQDVLALVSDQKSLRRNLATVLSNAIASKPLFECF